MKKILDIITEKMEQAFVDAGYEASFGKVTVSNRPDLCQYQCNGALSAAKQYKCAPIQIAKAVAEKLDSSDFSMIDAVMPGFINLKLSDSFLQSYLEEMRTAEDFGIEKIGAGLTAVVDYGGANVAKPLHIGHLRPAIIGETLKRLHKFMGYNTIGDVHLGDWGLQMGLIIAELQERQPELPYFDETFTGEYPKESPLHSPSWRRSIPPHLPRRLTRSLRRKPMPLPLNCKTAVAAIALSGITLWASAFRTSIGSTIFWMSTLKSGWARATQIPTSPL